MSKDAVGRGPFRTNTKISCGEIAHRKCFENDKCQKSKMNLKSVFVYQLRKNRSRDCTGKWTYCSLIPAESVCRRPWRCSQCASSPDKNVPHPYPHLDWAQQKNTAFEIFITLHWYNKTINLSILYSLITLNYLLRQIHGNTILKRKIFSFN